MSDHCCSGNACSPAAAQDPRYRRILWLALILNALMFVVEIVAGMRSGSVSLLADAIDFFGDAANYGVSLAVLSMPLVWRSGTALLKGVCMGSFGLFILGKTLWNLSSGTLPEASTMGVVGFVALLVNLGVALALYAYRSGDANMRAVWLCSRNDAINNIAVMLAALGVFGTGAAWPDLLVAALMGTLALVSSLSVIRHARSELAGMAPAGSHEHAGHSH